MRGISGPGALRREHLAGAARPGGRLPHDVRRLGRRRDRFGRQDHDQGTGEPRAGRTLRGLRHARQPQQPHRRAADAARHDPRHGVRRGGDGRERLRRTGSAGIGRRAELRHPDQHRPGAPRRLRRPGGGAPRQGRAVRLPGRERRPRLRTPRGRDADEHGRRTRRAGRGVLQHHAGRGPRKPPRRALQPVQHRRSRGRRTLFRRRRRAYPPCCRQLCPRQQPLAAHRDGAQHAHRGLLQRQPLEYAGIGREFPRRAARHAHPPPADPGRHARTGRLVGGGTRRCHPPRSTGSADGGDARRTGIRQGPCRHGAATRPDHALRRSGTPHRGAPHTPRGQRAGADQGFARHRTGKGGRGAVPPPPRPAGHRPGTDPVPARYAGTKRR